MAPDNGQRRLEIPEPDEGYYCTAIYFFDSAVGHTVDGDPPDIVRTIDAFKATEDPWLLLYEPVWQKPVIIERGAVFRIMSVVGSWVKDARPTSTRKPVEVYRKVPLPPRM